MDKKNAIFGAIFLVAALGAMWWNSQQEAERQRQRAEAAQQAAEQAEAEGPADAYADGVPVNPLVQPAEIVGGEDAAGAPLVRAVRQSLDAENAPETTAILQNDYFRATFTTRGAALKTIALTERNAAGRLVYPVDPGSEDPVVIHALAKTGPLSLAQRIDDRFSPVGVGFSIVEQSDGRIVFETELSPGVSLRRTYTTVPGEHDTPSNFTIRQELEVLNGSDAPVRLDRLFVNIGTAAPTNADPYGMDLNASYYETGDYHNIKATKFRGGMFSDAQSEVVREGQIEWGAVKNQFFASILTPATPGTEIVALPVKFPTPADAKRPLIGVTAFLSFDFPALPPGESESMAFDFYSGPKDFTRLKQMSLNQEDVMHFGWFLGMFVGIVGFVGKSLFTLLSTLHGWIGNWGFSIIGMTLIVRLGLWPLTAKAARSSKRMQELQKPMAELKEKYKDNPQKQQQATLELFKKHKINPLASCWPVMIQFPIFIAMFNLLRNTADLRFADFLWIGDLSMPDRSISLGDTSIFFFGNAINILPFIWIVSMWFQMKLMPQPSVDNAQTKVIKYMPFLFFPATYHFSSGLVLYWTTTNCFSIFQGWMTRRSKDAEDIAIEEEIAESEKKKSLIKSTPLGGRKRKKKGGDQPGVR